MSEGSLKRSRWNHLPSPSPSMYHLETLRDIYINLPLTLLFLPKEMTWILTQFETPMLAIGQVFNTAVRLTFWSDNSLLQGTVLCIVEYLAVSVVSTHRTPVGPPPPPKISADIAKCPLRSKTSPSVDSHCLGRFITKEDDFNPSFVEATFSEASASPFQSKRQKSHPNWTLM